MKKAIKTKSSAPKTRATKAPKRKAAVPAKRAAKTPATPSRAKVLAASKAPAPPADEGKLTFNHAMIYVKDVQRSLSFYRDFMGFKLIEDFRYEGTPVYARLRAPGGDGTIALHQAGPGCQSSATVCACTSRSASLTTSVTN